MCDWINTCHEQSKKWLEYSWLPKDPIFHPPRGPLVSHHSFIHTKRNSNHTGDPLLMFTEKIWLANNIRK